jgi:hypothetical protein
MEQSNTEDRYMLTSAELVRLERQTRDRTILSVYLNGEGSDSVSRARWQADLRHSLDDIASWFRDASHQEREDFAARRRLLEERVEQFRGEIGAPGWVAFLDEEGIQHQSEVFAPVPTMAVWSTGASVAPYIRALKESHPVIVAVVDSRHARLYRYVENGLELLERIEADTDFEVVGNMSKRAAQGSHTGRRGKTGTDAGQVALHQATERMLSDAVSRMETLAHDAAWIAIGGIPVVATAALSLLTPAAASRSLRAELDVHATDAQVAECARTSASQLRNASDLARVRETIAAAQANHVGAVGSVDTMRALAEGRARHLFFTLTYLEKSASGLETAVRSAFDHGTAVEHVSGEAASLLEGVGGVAASLRYVPNAASEPDAQETGSMR